jgi:hypothetical protein
MLVQCLKSTLFSPENIKLYATTACSASCVLISLIGLQDPPPHKPMSGANVERWLSGLLEPLAKRAL